LSIEKA